MKEKEVAQHLSKVGKYISEKIAWLNGGCRTETSTRKRKLTKPGGKKNKRLKPRLDSAHDASENEDPAQSGSAVGEGHEAIDPEKSEDQSLDETVSVNSDFFKDSTTSKELENISDKEDFDNDVSTFRTCMYLYTHIFCFFLKYFFYKAISE